MTMKRIFLCSSFADVASILLEFVPTPLEGKTIAFIPTASIHDDYTQYVDDAKAALVSLGLIIKDLEITQYSTTEIEGILNDCDCIYVSGGNTFFLMQELRRTGTDKLLIDQIENGKLYIGESAGTMILASNIEYAKDMDNHLEQTPGFTDFSGLGVIDFYPIIHYNSFPFEEATKKVIQKNKYLSLKIITNKQAITIIDDKVTIKENK